MRGHGKDELFVEVSSAFVKVNSTNHERGGIYFYISESRFESCPRLLRLPLLCYTLTYITGRRRRQAQGSGPACKEDLMAENTAREAHVAYENENAGSVKIADDVISCIAALAATEVEGVDSMAGNITNELISKLGVKNLSKGVKLDLHDGEVSVALSLNITYGYNIPEVSQKVQDRVKNTVENMTGLHVTDVSISIAGVNTGEGR